MMSERKAYVKNDSTGLMLIIAVVSIFFIVDISMASPNDECFGCHINQNRIINQSLYNSNPHNILECIDCHVNSISRDDTNHGQFIRQLNGSNVTGPLTTRYYSDNFSLCYYCHAEENVVGILPDYVSSSSHVNTTPIVVSSIGTNFINNHSSGYHNGGPDIPTNIHWNHLDDFGSINSGELGKFDYNLTGRKTSYQSCPACHNVHGTTYPKMTKNDIAITYSSDINGTFGYIGSDDMNRPGGDLYCNAMCHTYGTTFKYYRNETTLSEDCISCHAASSRKDVNITAFSQGVHLNINTTDGTDLVNNSDCWTCHYQKDMNRSNIYTCVNCHVNRAIPGAPQITSHKPEKTNKSSCEACHALVKINPGLNDIGLPIPNIISHYAQLPAVPTTNYCDYCHGPDASSPFQAPYRNIPSFFHNSSNASFPENTNCRTCHTRTDVIADPLAKNNTNFHELTTEYGDVKNTGAVANCVYCHIDHNTAFANAPTPSHSTKDMVLDNCYLCHGTKVTGTNKQKLHDVRSFVTTGCIPCHEVLIDINTSMFGRHKNLNTTEGGQNNMTDDDCMTCHFGSKTGDLPMIPNGANYNNSYICDDCHTAAGTGRSIPANLKPADLQITLRHGSNNCLSCHAPDMYHAKGTAGPRGRVENPGWQLISPIDYTGCLDCHLNHNGLDAPFHGPGIYPNTTSGLPKNHMAASGSPRNGSGCKDSCHLYDVHRVTQSTNSKKPTLSTPVLVPAIVANNEPVEVTSRGSSQDGFTSLQIEAARYQVKDNSGNVIINWTAMNAKDGRFNSSIETVNATISTAGLSEGTYNVSVKVMASGPKPGTLPEKLLPYYPLNGDWSNPIGATFTIKQSRFVNGTVTNTTGSLVSGANITAKNLISAVTYSAVTDNTGFFSLSLSSGTYVLIAGKDPEYYICSTITTVDLESAITATRDIILTKKSVGTIRGTVTKI
jgi:hypothetical protein